MTEGRSTTTTKSGTTSSEKNGSRRTTPVPSAQEAADMIKNTAERAAERWPEAVASAQVAARDTQQALERMPNQGLVIGTSFSIGLGVGLFMSGANRLLVLLALAPAAAMAATLVSRDEGSATTR
jgi:ElaB/YqjD/DUF883 family membrane-anchored ribosome-binding protein